MSHEVTFLIAWLLSCINVNFKAFELFQLCSEYLDAGLDVFNSCSITFYLFFFYLF